jgi:hypothetical protein
MLCRFWMLSYDKDPQTLTLAMAYAPKVDIYASVCQKFRGKKKNDNAAAAAA